MNIVIVGEMRMGSASHKIIVVTVPAACYHSMLRAVLLKDLVVMVVLVTTSPTLLCVNQDLTVVQSHVVHILCIVNKMYLYMPMCVCVCVRVCVRVRMPAYGMCVHVSMCN